RVYLTGGISWALANYVRPDNRRAFVELSADDIDTFAQMVTGDEEQVRVQCSAKVSSAKAKQDLAEDLQRIQKTFRPKQLTAGAEILRTLSGEIGFGRKKVYFARHGQFAWMLMYALEKSANQ